MIKELIQSGRRLAPKAVQTAAKQLHNRGTAPKDYGAFSESHSRIKIIATARLASHILTMRKAGIFPKGSNVDTKGALYHTLNGTKNNPFIHALPAMVLINGVLVPDVPKNVDWSEELIDIFHTGIMAPDNYEELGFEALPKFLNQADMSTERRGSVKALQELAANLSTYDGGDAMGFYCDQLLSWKHAEQKVVTSALSAIDTKYKNDQKKQVAIAQSHCLRIKNLKTMPERLESYYKAFTKKAEGFLEQSATREASTRLDE